MESIPRDNENEAIFEPHFRIAEIVDAPHVLTIYNEAVKTQRACGHVSPVKLFTVVEWIESASATRPFWVVEQQGMVVGWFAVENFYGLPAFDQAVEVSLYLEEQAQGRGLGGKILNYLEGYLSLRSITHLIANVYSHNHASLKLFKAHDYKCWGNLPKIAKLQEKTYDLIVLGKCLLPS